MILSTVSVDNCVDNLVSDLVRCGQCEGRKEVVALGGIRKKCPGCNGVGWKEIGEEVSKEPEEPEEPKDPDVKDVVVRKKMGRPKRGV